MRQLPLYDGTASLALEQSRPEVPDPTCSKCALSTGVRSPCIKAEVMGPTTGDVLLVVGPPPGNEEDRANRLLVSATGRYVRELTKNWPGPVVLDSAYRCAPGERKIAPGVYDSCRSYLAQTYQEAQPARILAFGEAAMRAVTGEHFQALSARRGYAYTSAGVPVFMLMAPIAALTNRMVRAQLEDDVRWALTATPPQPPHAAVALVIDTNEQAEEAADECRMAGGVSFDFETFGAVFNSEFQILNAAFTPYGSDCSFVLDAVAMKDPKLVVPFASLLVDPTLPKAGWNVKYDAIVAQYRLGTLVRPLEDVMLWRKLLEADVERNLAVAQTLVGMTLGKANIAPYKTAGAKELRDLIKKPAQTPVIFSSIDQVSLHNALVRITAGDEAERYTYAAIPPDVLSKYNALDTVSTDRLRRYFNERFDREPDFRNVWETITQPMLHALTQMELNGIHADIGTVRKLQALCTQQLADARQTLDQYGADFNPNSGDQVAALLFGRLKLKPGGKTDGGKFSTSSDILEKLNHPAAQAIIAFRKATKFKSQYADGMEFYVRDDGRIHTSYNLDGTGTGRPSGEDPNLLNIPRATSPEGKLCRDIFDAEFGFVLVEFDYSQIELRVAALLSNDRLMIELFQDSSKDFHLETARMIAPMLGYDPADIDKEHPLRDQAKTVNFAALYGDPPAGLAMKLGVDVKTAERLQNAILGKFVHLKRWISERLAFARQHGYCRTYWNGREFRRRPLLDLAGQNKPRRETAERSAWNTPIQGSAAEYMNASLGVVQPWLEATQLPARLVLTVYDSMILEVREDAVDPIIAGVKGIMQSWPAGDVPLKADVKVGRSWGSMEKRK